jgi:prepilin-type N-terminal cleavage/methylation domain-containing protein
MRKIIRHKAFTIIELLFVIVVLGIVGTVALGAIKEYFRSGIIMTEVDKRVAEADTALDQISPYFENAIAESITRLDIGTGNTCYGPPVNADANNRAIAFVSVDTDSRRGEWDAAVGRYVPGWSEDVNISGLTMRSIGANYNFANMIIGNYYGSVIENSVIYNRDRADLDASGCSSYKWNIAGSGDSYLDITNHNANSISFLWPANVIPVSGTSESRYLISTAYAFEVDSAGNFIMYNNFRPWLNQKFNAGTSHAIMNNAASFSVMYDRSATAALDGMGSKQGMFYILKLCMNGLTDDNLSKTDAETQICRQRSVHVRY